MKDVKLTAEEKDILVQVILNQKYGLELIGSEIADIERKKDAANENTLKKLNDLYDVFAKAGN